MNLQAMLFGHFVAGPLWITSIATALIVMSRLPLALRGTSNISPISASWFPKPMTGTVMPTFFSFFLAANSLVITDWLLPPSKESPTSVLPIFTRCLNWNT
jgi:hypothetical protein